jgi:superfamily II DNA or RNA helicase
MTESNAPYLDFLAKKALRAKHHGLATVPPLADHLFPYQRHCVEFSLRAGGSGCFLDTGLGKTEIALEWCQKAIEATNEKALILTPLAVAAQTKRRADRWGYEARVIRSQGEAKRGINICNYDRLHRLDPAEFGIVCLDEASILKSFNGKTTRELIGAFKGHRFKLCATATPAPNDHMELGSYSDFLEIMAPLEMLAKFFVNDTSRASQQWRLKGYAVQSFWDWLASWARMAEKPSDLGDKDDGFILPPFQLHRHRARNSKIDDSLADIFGAPAMTATSLHQIKRRTSEARAEMLAAVITPQEPWVIWCDTDYESETLKKAIPGALEVKGSQSADEKENRLEAFATGRKLHLIGKPSMCGFGLDWSHCANMAFVGRSYSYETFYQAVRRCWRFGQKKTVNVHLIVAEGEETIGRVIDRKSGDHDSMKRAMRDSMARAMGRSAVVRAAYEPTSKVKLQPWIKSSAA